jgi:hypothetical protein
MGLGLLKLVAVGNENEILNANPEITFFKKKIENVNYFRVENIPQYFKSIPTFGRRVTLNLSKIGDLINNISLYIELQDIPPSNHTVLPSGVKKFAWMNKIGLGLVKYIDIEIDGIMIERQYNDYLNILYETNSYYFSDLNNMIGDNIKVLTDYTNGKESYKLHIPLKFFFNLDKYLSLPIYLLSKQDVKIHLELNSFEDCYNQSPTHYFEINENICLFKKGENIVQNFNNEKSIGKFVYFDNVNKRVYYDKVFNDFLIPSISNKTNTKYNIIGKTSGFKLNPKENSIIVRDESYFINEAPPLKDALLFVDYVFLDNNIKAYFKKQKRHYYIIPLVQNVLDKNITSVNNNYKLTLTHPHKILYWRAIMDSNILLNDIFNYSSYPVTDNEEPLINKVKLMINSIPRVDINNYEFYTHFMDYINTFKSNRLIYKYSFCENPKSNRPNGTLNFSKIDDAYLKLNLNKVVSFQNPINLRLYGVYYNVFVIENNTGSLKFIH